MTDQPKRLRVHAERHDNVDLERLASALVNFALHKLNEKKTDEPVDLEGNDHKQEPSS